MNDYDRKNMIEPFPKVLLEFAEEEQFAGHAPTLFRVKGGPEFSQAMIAAEFVDRKEIRFGGKKALVFELTEQTIKNMAKVVELYESRKKQGTSGNPTDKQRAEADALAQQFARINKRIDLGFEEARDVIILARIVERDEAKEGTAVALLMWQQEVGKLKAELIEANVRAGKLAGLLREVLDAREVLDRARAALAEGDNDE